MFFKFHYNKKSNAVTRPFRARAGDAIHPVLWLVKGLVNETMEEQDVQHACSSCPRSMLILA